MEKEQASPKINQETVLYLNLLLVNEFHLELFDELEKLPKFSQSLKKKANSFRKELEKLVEKDLDLIFRVKGQEHNMYKIMNAQKEILQKIAYSKPELTIVISKFLEQYKLAPEAWNVKLGLSKNDQL